MTSRDPRAALDALYDEYSRRATAIRRDLGLQRNADFAEQAVERQNDEVLEALLAEADRDTPGVLVRELYLAAMAEERLTWGIYRDRRPEMYGALLSLDGQGHRGGRPS